MKTEYTDNNGNTFEADELLPCPFCGRKPVLSFSGKEGRQIWCGIECKNLHCRAEMVFSTIKNSYQWIAEIAINAWNKRV